MNREPPSNVKKILRQEVNYGCPFPDCGSPFLTWHHFHPKWSVKEHHNPDGMIALCAQHHLMADAEAFSPDQLRGFKKNPNLFDSIKTKFPWMPEHCVIRLGGCYASDWCRITVLGYPILEIKKDQNEVTTLSFILKNEKDDILSTMTENFFECVSNIVHDFTISASGNHIKIWSERRLIGFECHYSRKFPIEIENYIQKDTPDMADFVEQPSQIDNLEKFYKELSEISEFMPEVAAIGYNRNDPVGTSIRWHVARHMGDGGKIPFLNFVSCRFYHSGKCVELRDGKLGGLEFCGGNTFSF